MSQKKKVGAFFENVGEAAAACLTTILQGNLLVLGVGHRIIASQTGIAAGVLDTVALLLAKTQNRLAISATLGVITAVVDYLFMKVCSAQKLLRLSLPDLGGGAFLYRW